MLLNLLVTLPPPSWALFPQGIRNTIRVTHSQGYNKTQAFQHSWVYQATKEMERLTAKLVSSTTEVWTPAPNLAWLLKHLHTQHKEHPLLYYIVPRAMPSFLVLFRVCKEENQLPRSVCEVPSHTSFIKLFQTPFPLPNRFRDQTKMYTQQL